MTAPDQTVSMRQLAASVRFGRKVTITAPEFDKEPITGYISGWDDEFIFVAVPAPLTPKKLRKRLVHRDAISGIDLHDDSTMSAEKPDVRAALEQIIGRFREIVIENYFTRRP